MKSCLNCRISKMCKVFNDTEISEHLGKTIRRIYNLHFKNFEGVMQLKERIYAILYEFYAENCEYYEEVEEE